MSKIILVDPQDSNEKYWWIGIVVDPLDYELFFSEMVGKVKNESNSRNDSKKNISNKSSKNEDDESNESNKNNDSLSNSKNSINSINMTVDEKNYLVCYFEDGSYSTVNKKEVIELNYNSKPFTDWLKEKGFKNSKAVKNLYKYLNDKIPAKFKWLKKKRKINGEGAFKKKVWKKRADKLFGDKNE
ncbi:hypothetical protein BDAP_001325 [Binucleata daphniae]